MQPTIATIQTPTIEHDGRTHRMFFVRGRMRSGTNWICNLLNLHPQINCHGEFHFEKLQDGFQQFAAEAEQSTGLKVAAAARLGFQDTVKRCLAACVDPKPGASWVGDRSPSRIDDWFPEVPVIHTVRDGRDAVVSWLQHAAVHTASFNNPSCDAWLAMYRNDHNAFDRDPHGLVANEDLFRHASRTWSDHVRADLETIARIHRGELNTPMHAIRYEDLHADAEGARRGMYEFLGLDPDEAMPLSTETGTLPGSPREAGIGQAQVGCWSRYFTDESKQWMKEEAGELLVELGYTEDMNW